MRLVWLHQAQEVMSLGVISTPYHHSLNGLSYSSATSALLAFARFLA